MIRVIVQIAPELYSLSLVAEEAIRPTFEYDGRTFYKAETHDHYLLYKPAISGWGAYGFDPAPGQR